MSLSTSTVLKCAVQHRGQRHTAVKRKQVNWLSSKLWQSLCTSYSAANKTSAYVNVVSKNKVAEISDDSRDVVFFI